MKRRKFISKLGLGALAASLMPFVGCGDTRPLKQPEQPKTGSGTQLGLVSEFHEGKLVAFHITEDPIDQHTKLRGEHSHFMINDF